MNQRCTGEAYWLGTPTTSHVRSACSDLCCIGSVWL